jgi:putative membrane protein
MVKDWLDQVDRALRAWMYTARHFPFHQALLWTRVVFLWTFVWSTSLTLLVVFGGLDWIRLPTLPVTVLGTAVSFYLGFKGNAAYARLWEARKIWGGIVNTSRTWGIHVRDLMREGEDVGELHTEFVYRHIAWLAALRIRLRRPKPWEHRLAFDDVFRQTHGTLDTSDETLRASMEPFLAADELDWVMDRQNHATQLLANQSRRLAECREDQRMDDFRHMELARILETLFTLQGKAERIKNFPLPRQYASANHWFVKGFIVLVPLALIGEFHDKTPELIWLGIPTSMALCWVFFVWDKIVDFSENPFEGLVNDIPMTAMARGIEIDLREILGETQLPPSLPSVTNVQV